MTFRRTRLALALLFFGTCFPKHVLAQPAGGPPIDPRAMSGIPRADAQTEPGTITVRCLLGSFSQPAAGATVELELKSADGGKQETRKVVAGPDGRASFADLQPYLGGTAVARAELDGEEVRSQPIAVSATEGFRVLLVRGAGEPGPNASPGAARPPGPAGANSPQSPHGDVPLPGVPFANPGTPKGTVLVGALDLNTGVPLPGARVRLVLTAGDGKSETREAISDGRGAARFTGLDALAPDVTLVAEADLPTGTERSQPFSLAGKDTGMAVVLAVAAPRAPVRRQLMGPRAIPTILPGTVRVTVVGPDDAPVADVPVTVVKQDTTGLDQRFEQRTGDDGVARVEGIPVGAEGLFHVTLTHAGAPWRSPFFSLDERMGVAVEMRVFPVTTDLGRVRSAVQFGVEPLENDLARVDQLYQVFVDGDAAYWPGRPYKLHPAEGATSMVVRDRADDALQHTRDAPFATIENPLPPGELLDLSIAYVLEHDGTAELRWTAPFPVVDARAVVVDGLKLVRGSKKPPVRPPHQAGEARPDLDVYELGPMPQGQAYDLAVSGLVTRPRLYSYLGLGLGLAVAFACGLAFALRPRASLRERLLRRKAALLRKLDAAGPGERDAVVAALDQVFCQLDALADRPRHADPGAAWSQGQS